jgi:N-acetylglucosamine kinase-like BadF-type ATPase
LGAALAAREGWGDATVLDAWVDELGGTPEGVLAWVYGDQYRPDDLATRAPTVFAAAREGDVVATCLIRNGVDHLARQMAACAGRDWHPAWPVGLAGGLGRLLLPWVAERVEALGLPPPVVVEGPPAEGAAWLARRFLAGRSPGTRQ